MSNRRTTTTGVLQIATGASAAVLAILGGDGGAATAVEAQQVGEVAQQISDGNFELAVLLGYIVVQSIIAGLQGIFTADAPPKPAPTLNG